MAPSKDEREAAAQFAERYGRPSSDAARQLERLVIDQQSADRKGMVAAIEDHLVARALFGAAVPPAMRALL